MKTKGLLYLTAFLLFTFDGILIAGDDSNCIEDNITSLLTVGNYWIYETYYPQHMMKTSLGSDIIPSISSIDSFHINQFVNPDGNGFYKAVRIMDINTNDPYEIQVNLRVAGDSLLEEYYQNKMKVEVGIWALCPMEIGAKWVEYNYNESTFYEIIAQEDKQVHSGFVYENCYRIKVKGINHNSGNILDTWDLWHKPGLGLVCKEWKEGLGENRMEAQQYLIRHKLK